MKRTKTILSLLLAAASLLAGCTPQPAAEPAAMQEDISWMIEKAGAQAPPAQAAESLAERYGIPERIELRFTEGRLSVEVDAPILAPEEPLPIAKVQGVGFSDAAAKAAFKYLIGDAPAIVQINPNETRTKAEVEESIAYYEYCIAEGLTEAYAMMSVEEAEAEIARLKEEWEHALDAEPAPIVADGSMRAGRFSLGDGRYEETRELDVEAGVRRLYVRRPTAESSIAQGYLSYSVDRGPDAAFGHSGEPLRPYTGPGMAERPQLSHEDAIAACMEVFGALGVSDIALEDTMIAGSDGQYAYRLSFVRTVAGVPVALNHEPGEYGGEAIPWNYEWILCYVSDAGLESLTWSAPTRLGEIVAEAAELLPYAEIEGIFKTMARAVYEPETTFLEREREIGLRVEEIRLSLLRIRERAGEGRNGLYIPAWIFYGEKTIDNKPGMESDFPRILLAINAIDGSVIDLDRGY